MGVFDKLFGKGKLQKNKVVTQRPLPPPEAPASAGTPQMTLDQAIAYWNLRNVRQVFDPFVLYTFDTADAARDALLDLDCIHKGEGPGGLVCTAPIIFGYYATEDGKYEAILAGPELTRELFALGKAAFAKHGGVRKNDQEEPEGIASAKPERPAKPVVFKRKYKQGESTYEEYTCEVAEDAKAFLLTKSVAEGLYYIVVETPEGNWGMDVKGLYKERLLPWQTDLSTASVEGRCVGMPDTFALQMAARGMNDNFVISVECGKCAQTWMEGVRYENWTVVECPECHTRSKVSTDRFKVVFTN